MAAVTVRLPDGSTREFDEGTTAGELAAAVGPRLAKAAVAATFDGVPVDLSAPLPEGAEVSVLTAESPAGREVIRHSTAHVLAQAVLRLWPGAKFAIGPVIEDGFYYDFELPGGAHFSDDDLERIAATMREIMAEDQPFVRHEHSIDEGLVLFEDQPFKREIIEAVAAGSDEVDAAAGDSTSAAVSTYWNSPTFTDLCRGPHVPSTSRLGHFALMRVAGAYWRGDEKREQLQRIYGTAWESEKALAEHLHRLEEAERRDHRRLGAELDLFSFPEEIGSGLPVFHPKGGTVRRVMEDYSRQRHVAAGYEFVNSPHITKAHLFETSGHLEWFAEGMFPPMELDGGQQYYIKPMNCPFHVLIFKSRQRSYRELPLRLFEFGTVYRYEKSGVVHGLTRVRGMTQDDAHIFCTADQMEGELHSTLDLHPLAAPRLRAGGVLPRALHSTRGEGRRERRGVGGRHRDAAESRAEHGPRARPRRGRRRVLRAEDLGAGQGRDRQVAPDVHHPARLPDTPALRCGVRRRRQREAPADHDPPRTLRFGRAILRDPARALRGRPPDLARARTGARARCARRSRGVRATRSPTGSTRSVCGSRSSLRTNRSIRGSAGRNWRRSPTSSSSVTKTCRRGPSGSTAGAANAPSGVSR